MTEKLGNRLKNIFSVLEEVQETENIFVDDSQCYIYIRWVHPFFILRNTDHVLKMKIKGYSFINHRPLLALATIVSYDRGTW